MNVMDALKLQKGILESQGYKVAYIALYGSQNYGLDVNNDEYQSDIDMKAIVIPTLDELIENSKPVSIVVDTTWGQCDVKDIRSYFETLIKANPAYIETLFTPYYIINDDFKAEMGEIRSLRDDLLHALRFQFIRAIYGMMCEKEKALCHPYPSIAHKIEQFGFDGKQLSHIYRLWLIMQDYFKYNISLDKCLVPQKEYVQLLIDLKLNRHSLEYAKSFMVEVMDKAKQFKDSILQLGDEATIDYTIRERFVILSQSIIKNKIMNEIKGD